MLGPERIPLFPKGGNNNERGSVMNASIRFLK
jgi:hypothetical protein